jgi:integrase
MPYNPLERVQARRRRLDGELRRKASKKDSTRAILRDEIPLPLELERIRLAIPGQYPLERRQRRALITLLAWVGLRPGEALYLRWLHLRNAFGQLDHVRVRGALKDIAGALEEGDTKTHENRDAISFPFVQAELDALYHAAGAPRLTALVFPNRLGEPARWDNFRNRSWYRALELAGVAEEANPRALGAFYPYGCATTARASSSTPRRPPATATRSRRSPRASDTPRECCSTPTQR